MTINKRDYVIRKFKITNYEFIHVNSDGSTDKHTGHVLGEYSKPRLNALIRKNHGSNCMLLNFNVETKKLAIAKDKYIANAIEIEGENEND